MGAPSKQAKQIRSASEFDLRRLTAEIRQPRDGRGTINAWSLAQIFDAREDQMSGRFLRPARMAEQMRTDDALAVAYKNRLAPQRCLPVEIRPAPGARGKSIAGEAGALFGRKGVGLRKATVADVHGCLVNHGVAFAVLEWTPRDDGTRVDVEVKHWPIEYVRWDPYLRTYFARTDLFDTAPRPAIDTPGAPFLYGANETPIVHGDGRWIVFAKHETDPFRQDAALLPAALVWARHAYACRDWAKGSVAHGSAKIVGELPAGVFLQNDESGGLTAEAAAFIGLLQEMATGDSPVGIRPAGSKTEFVTNNSAAWQVWVQLVENAEKAAARIYLGTDGTLGANGGAPGVDITALFGVASTIVRGDLECIEEGINTGAIAPWCAVNFGDSSLAPERLYKVPDEDKEANADSLTKRRAAFFADVAAMRANGFVVDAEYVASLAKKYDIDVPALAAVTPAPSAPTVRV